MAKNFEDMTTDEFVAYLETVLSPQPVEPGKACGGLPLYEIDAEELPVSLVKIANEILNSPDVVDHVPDGAMKQLVRDSRRNGSRPLNFYQTTITSPEPGAMRSWHSNEKNYLPELTLPADVASSSGLDIKDRRSKAQKYYQYIDQFKGQQNKMSGRTDGVQTGYIEFTGTGWRMGHQHGRLLYDFVRNRLYLTIHYQEVIKGKNPFFRIKCRFGAQGQLSS